MVKPGPPGWRAPQPGRAPRSSSGAPMSQAEPSTAGRPPMIGAIEPSSPTASPVSVRNPGSSASWEVVSGSSSRDTAAAPRAALIRSGRSWSWWAISLSEYIYRPAQKHWAPPAWLGQDKSSADWPNASRGCPGVAAPNLTVRGAPARRIAISPDIGSAVSAVRGGPTIRGAWLSAGPDGPFSGRWPGPFRSPAVAPDRHRWAARLLLRVRRARGAGGRGTPARRC